MEHTKTTSNGFSPFGLKQKIKKIMLTMSMLLACFGLKAQWDETVTKYGEGAHSLICDDSVFNNTAIGYYNLRNNCGNNNTCVGANAMWMNNQGNDNSVLGFNALIANTTGSSNCVFGAAALYSNTTGFNQVSIGSHSLYLNTSGKNNVAVGNYSLKYNTTGNGNATVGYSALMKNTTGGYNSALGHEALYQNTTGNYNTAIGYYAGPNSGTLSNSTAIGYTASVNASNKIRLGNASVTVVEGPVVYTVSDGRFKTNISESDVKGLEFIKKLRPVVYNFDTKKLDEFLNKDMPESVRKEMPEQDFSVSTAIRQSGFIAQEVEVAAKEAGYNFNGLHVPENENDNYSIAYGQFVVPLVKAVQELSKQNDALKKELDELKTMVKNNSSGTTNSIETSETRLFQNSPNPFDQATTIRYSISPLAKKAVLTIVSINGEKVKEVDLTGTNQDTVSIHAGELAPGNYVYSLVVDDKKIDSKKMTLTK